MLVRFPGNRFEKDGVELGPALDIQRTVKDAALFFLASRIDDM
jgi:hypothetical protein